MISLYENEFLVEYKKWNFPCGEVGVIIKLEDREYLTGYGINILYDYDGDSSIVELLMVGDAIKRIGCWIKDLCIPYVPYGRQDRTCNVGESLSLKVFCELINSLECAKVVITDPHSDVTPALLNNCHVVHQYEIFLPYLEKITEGYWLASPDAGALKKIYESASRANPIGVLECSKHRDVKTGKITGVGLPANFSQVKNLENIIILDDICDGGSSFIYLAKAFKEKGFSGKIILMVTHGFFTKGLSVFDGLIEEVYSRKGRVK